MNRIAFEVSDPVCKKNRMRVGRGHVYKDPTVEAYEFRVKVASRHAAYHLKEPLKGSILVSLVYDHKLDKLHITLEEMGPKTKRKRKDLVNLLDTTFDAMEGIVFDNDDQIESVNIRLGTW